MNIITPSYEDVVTDCVQISNSIKDKQLKFDYIVGLSRGGLIPSVMLSHMLSIPLKPVSYSSRQGAGDDQNHANELPSIYGSQSLSYPSLLIVDDICDTGNTLDEVVDHYTNEGHVVSTAVLYYKTLPVNIITPTFWSHTVPFDLPWIVFPWEVYMD